MAAMSVSAWESPVLKQVLLGCYDEASPLALFRGHTDVLMAIFNAILDFWTFHVTDTSSVGMMQCTPKVGAPVPCVMPGRRKRVQFPPPWSSHDASFNVNMMPFIMGDVSSLPPSCVRYHDMILHCVHINRSDEHGKIGYLTIHESTVEAGTAQRRPGLHVEAAGRSSSIGFVTTTPDPVWGGGFFAQNCIHGGVYMASTVADSCGVYNMTIRDHHMVTGALGDVEHLRPLLEKLNHKYVLLQANELIWMTDRTPHESLPLLATTFRQYFRLVTSGVSHWYADHSTPNPLGIQPNATVIHGNKLRNVVAQDDSLAPIKVWPLVTADARATEITQMLE